MVRSRGPTRSESVAAQATGTDAVFVNQSDNFAVQRLARELQLFAGILGGASADNVSSLLEPVFDAIPIAPAPLAGWIVRALLVNALQRIDAHFGEPPSSTGMELLWRSTSPAMVRDIFQQHLGELSESQSASTRAPQNSCGDSRIDRALDYIRAHCSSPSLAIDEVSAFVRLSRWHFSRLFTRYLGMGFRDTVRGLRMEQATALLNEGLLSIKEIAARLGFVHPTEFDRQFKQSFGITPTEWRARRVSATHPHLRRRAAH